MEQFPSRRGAQIPQPNGNRLSKRKEAPGNSAKGGCRVFLTHAEGLLVDCRQDGGAGAEGAACCVPRWSGCVVAGLGGALYTRQRGGGQQASCQGRSKCSQALGGARPAVWLVSALLPSNLEEKSAVPCRSFPQAQATRSDCGALLIPSGTWPGSAGLHGPGRTSAN